MYSPELESKIAELSSKVNDGTLTKEEMREIIIRLRGERLTAMTAPKKPSTRKKKVSESPTITIDLDSLTSQIEGKTK